MGELCQATGGTDRETLSAFQQDSPGGTCLHAMQQMSPINKIDLPENCRIARPMKDDFTFAVGTTYSQFS